MKNKYVHDLTKQHHHDLRKCEENIQRLADDITRVERMFEVLWEEMRRRGAEIANTPHEQKLKCLTCGEMTSQYKIEVHEGGYVKDIICVPCHIKKEDD